MRRASSRLVCGGAVINLARGVITSPVVVPQMDYPFNFGFRVS